MASKIQNALLAHCCNSSGYCTLTRDKVHHYIFGHSLLGMGKIVSRKQESVTVVPHHVIVLYTVCKLLIKTACTL